LDAIVEAEFKDIKTLGQAGLQETASGHGTPQVACDRRVAFPGVSTLTLSTEGTGLSVSLRNTKK